MNTCVGIDLHRRRSVIVRMTPSGEVLEIVRVDNDPVALSLALAKAGPDPEVVLEATYGWYWAADLLQACGARVHLAHPLGSRCSATSGPETDARDSRNLAELLRMDRLPKAWLAPPAVRELRELVRYRAKLVALRSGLKAQVHAVLAKEGVRVPMSDLFGWPAAGCWTSCSWDEPMGCELPRCAASLPPTTRRSPCWGGDLHGPGRRRRRPGTPGHPRGGAGAGGGVRGRDRRHPPLRRRAPVVLLGRAHPHHRESDTTVVAAPSPNKAPAGPLGRRRGHPAAPRSQQAGRLVPPHRRPARHQPSAAWPPPAGCSPWSCTACATARSAAWHQERRWERLGRSRARARVCHDPRLAAWSPV